MMSDSILIEKIDKLQKQLDQVTVVVDLMARIEHARQDKIKEKTKEKKYLYLYKTGNASLIQGFYHKREDDEYQYIGKIKPEVDDE